MTPGRSVISGAVTKPTPFPKDRTTGTHHRLPISTGEKTNGLPVEPCSQTTVIKNLQDFRERPRDFAGSWFSITALGSELSNRSIGGGFQEGKPPDKRGLGPSSFFPVTFGSPYKAQWDTVRTKALARRASPCYTGSMARKRKPPQKPPARTSAGGPEAADRKAAERRLDALHR
jgi:hypothetical protein